MAEKNWQYELEEYIKQGEPTRAERSYAWRTAIGLQDVDGLETSEYLLDTAKEHIEGKINISEAQKRIESYYRQSVSRKQKESHNEEADIVASRIAELLGEKAFQFSPAEYKEIHRRLFAGVFDYAGKIRDYNISKPEWVLNGDTVTYASFESIIAALDYDFKMEKEFDYSGLSVDVSVKHIAKFASDIWQIHPFGEGNTRATAVFVIKYLKTFGFDINNDIFAENSWYFRNALVRANYNNLKKGVTATTEYLERFLENLLLGKDNELKNRFLHIGFGSDIKGDKNVTLANKNVTFKELAIINILKSNPKITQEELANKIGKTKRTAIRNTTEMQSKGLIRRKGGKQNGEWEILIETE